MVKISIIKTFLFAILLTNCSSVNLPDTNKVLPKQTLISTLPNQILGQPGNLSGTPTLSSPPTLTITNIPSQTPIPTVNATIAIKNSMINSDCLNIVTKPFDNQNFRGKIALYGQNHHPSSILDLETGKKQDLSRNWKPQYYFSPDGKWILSYGSGFRFTLMQADGKIVKVFNGQNGWDSFNWFDNEHLGILRPFDQPSSLYSFTLYNPFTDRLGNQLNPIYPDIYRTSSKNTHLDFDPTLTRVVYPRMNNMGNAFVLWEIQNNKPLAILPTYEIENIEPQWSPDGTQFIVPIQKDGKFDQTSDFYSVTLDGKITQLTQFEQEFAKGQIYQYSWSPDGKYIAFWMALEPEKNPAPRLAVLDVNQKKVTDYCIPGPNYYYPGIDNGTYPDPFRSPASPQWSPNGKKQVVFNFEDQNRIIHTVLVDLDNNLAIEIAQDQANVFWKNIFPEEWMK